MATSSHLDESVLSGSLPRLGSGDEATPRVARKRMRLRRRRILWGAAALTLAGAGTAWFVTHRGPRPTPVQTAVVGRADLQAKVTANGRVQAQKKVDISATIAGQITHLAVEEGDRVKKGQFLLQIDAANPRAAARGSEASMQALLREVDSARAQLGQAQIGFSARRGEPRRAHHRDRRPRPGAHGPRHRRGRSAGRGAPGRAGEGHPRGRAGHAGQDHGRWRPSTVSSPPGGWRRARSR